MQRIKIFISSVQKEFSEERKLISNYIREDALLGKFFEPFIFEEIPAVDLSAQEAYISEVGRSDIYLGIYGQEYGFENDEGISPTELEYNEAVAQCKYRLIFIKRTERRNPKEELLIKRIEQHVIRKSFSDYEELRTAVYISLVRYMEEKELLRLLPWDATFHKTASLQDIDPEKVSSFVQLARERRHFKLQFSEENILDILIHLHVASSEGRITNAALMLFAKNPQQFFITSEVKCMIFPTEVKKKPMLSYQVYHGTVFELVDSAVGFIMQHIDAYVGTHTTTSVNVKYEIPIEAVTELIVNAITHRSYESNGSVEVMLFKDRLEVWNPGQLPAGLTPAKLKEAHNSLPTNPTLANSIYLAGYIERVGTGTTDVVELCQNAGLKTPEFIQDEDFRAIIWRKNVPQNDMQFSIENQSLTNNDMQNVPLNVPLNVPQKQRLLRVRKILELIISNKRISTEEIGQQLGVSYKTIRRDIDSLRSSYRIEWKGPSKTGYWEIEKLN